VVALKRGIWAEFQLRWDWTMRAWAKRVEVLSCRSQSIRLASVRVLGRGELQLIPRARVAPFGGAGSQLDNRERTPRSGKPAGFDVPAYL